MPSASARQRISTLFSCWTIFATTTRRIIWRDFPWHPHRGIETITYVLAGSVEHGDSLGNKGKITAGDVQWMTAGSGILHQEMPKGDAAGPHARLPTMGEPACFAEDDQPRYQDIPSSEIPEVTDDDGTRVRIICGEFWGKQGPVEGVGRIRSISISRFRRAAETAEGRDHAQRLRLCVRRFRHLP